MNRETSDSTVTASRKFVMKEQPCASNTSEPARNSSIDAIKLRTLQLKVKQLEAQKITLELQIRKLTMSLAVTLSRTALISPR